MAKATATNPAPATAAASDEIKGIKYSLFNKLAVGTVIVIAGVLKSIGSKDTNYGPVTKFKGDFGVKIPGVKEPVRASTAFFPAAIEKAIVESASKNVKWSSLEFRLNVTRTEKGFESITFSIPARPESDRVSAMLA